MQTGALRFSMVGLSKWESDFVQASVDLASGLEIAPWRFVDDPKRADVLLVDGDRRSLISTTNGEESHLPIVVSFSADSEATLPDATRDLTRPVGYADLISVLKDIEKELHESANQIEQQATVVPVPVPNPIAAPAANPHPPSADERLAKTRSIEEALLKKARPARRFVEDTRLLGLLKTIQRHGSSAAVRHPRFPTFLVIPAHNVFASFRDPTSIPRMFRDSSTTFSVTELAAKVEARALASEWRRPLGQLLYCAALFGSRGRLMLSNRPDDTLCLIGLPDFDVLPHVQEHRQIAKYMIARSTHLAEIAASTGASVDNVIDFCNACEAVGLLQRNSIHGDQSATDIDERGVLRLFGYMRDLFKET